MAGILGPGLVVRVFVFMMVMMRVVVRMFVVMRHARFTTRAAAQAAP